MFPLASSSEAAAFCVTLLPADMLPFLHCFLLQHEQDGSAEGLDSLGSEASVVKVHSIDIIKILENDGYYGAAAQVRCVATRQLCFFLRMPIGVLRRSCVPDSLLFLVASPPRVRRVLVYTECYCRAVGVGAVQAPEARFVRE